VNQDERFWPARLRWRLRGATMWPAFVVLTFADGLVLHLLPPIRTGVDLIPGILIATFANLFLIGAVAPFLAGRMRARQPGPPAPEQAAKEVLVDRFGTALLLAGLVGVVAAGLATRPLVVSETRDTEANARAVRDYVFHSGNQEMIRNVETANTIRLADGYFRTCIARDDRTRNFCFFVNTHKHPVELKRDRSAEPNSAFRVR
jgi:hypothetical protein